MENYNDVYLLAGGNLNNTIEKFNLLFQKIEKQIGNIIKKSNFYESESWGFHSQYRFVNVAIYVQTKLKPSETMKEIKQIEKEFGREKNNTSIYQDRNVDIDIIFYNNLTINSEDVTIPHLHMHERMFVLKPLAEIAPAYIHPIFHKSVKQLMDKCTDKLLVKIINL